MLLQTYCTHILRHVAATPISRYFGGATAAKKRFYKNVTIVESGGNFEINLDQRKLKTPSGSTFQVSSEPLAHAVANEWMSQKDKIILSQMHLNGLCNTAQDNPGRVDKEKLVEAILSYLRTDTVLYYAEEPPELLELQIQNWSPIINWFRETYDVSLEPTTSICPPTVSEDDLKSLERHFMSYNLPTLHGLSFGVDALKSIILTLAALQRRITVEKAVELSRLELLHQTSQWGNVEWAHDIELHGTTARLAASVMFVHLQSGQESKRTKNPQG